MDMVINVQMIRDPGAGEINQLSKMCRDHSLTFECSVMHRNLIIRGPEKRVHHVVDVMREIGLISSGCVAGYSCA